MRNTISVPRPVTVNLITLSSPFPTLCSFRHTYSDIAPRIIPHLSAFYSSVVLSIFTSLLFNIGLHLTCHEACTYPQNGP